MEPHVATCTFATPTGATQLLTTLNAAPHPNVGTDFFAHVGSHMALARTIPPAWFPKTGSATEAQIGGLIANLHSLTTVAWGAYPLNGAANMTAWMIGMTATRGGSMPP